MKTTRNFILTFIIPLVMVSCGQTETEKPVAETPSEKVAPIAPPIINTPDEALAELKNGNQRFLNAEPINIGYKEQIESTKLGQKPHSLILSCLDSRVPPEIIFDQGIGNIFVARVAGNIEDPNIIGSMEFATKVVETKLIVVMGHNKCGAVKGAIDNAVLGNLTQLVDQIKPAITGDKNNPDEVLDETAKNNVKMTIADILRESSVLKELISENKVKIVGAYYDITTGKVTFLD